MDTALAVRMFALYAPATFVALICTLRPPTRGRAVGALLASAWNLPSLLLVNVLAMELGWWTFAPSPVSIMGVPLELLLGWVLLWGALPVLLFGRIHILVTCIALGILDLFLMPLSAPAVRLGDFWLVGEAVALFTALLPSQLFARWTEQDQHVELRASLQAVAFAALTVWVLPAVLFEQAAGSWDALLDNWHRFGGVHLQLAALFALLGVSAVQEFAQRGRGTPIPFDPPKRLVTSGPYAYVANPMQLSLVLVLTAWGIILQNPWVILGGPMAMAYGMGLAESDERADLDRRFGKQWRDYRRQVSAWIPRWRPYHRHVDNAEPDVAPARLYVAGSCERCSEVARWFAVREPRGLAIVPAELHPRRDLSRVTYDPQDGGGEHEGVAAIARALEHIHLGWALLGWLIRLPGLVTVLQLLVDASGGEARVVRRTVERAECPV